MDYGILGPLEARDDGREVALGGAKQRTLLAILLLHANRVVARDRLIDGIWADDPPETARATLQVYVSQLRKALGADTIVTRAPGYLIEVGDEELDAKRFERFAAEARGKPAAEAADGLRKALGLWRGDALADLNGSLVESERDRLEEQRLIVLEALIDTELELGRHAELVPELEELVRQYPLRERFRGQLMLALYRSGRQPDALEVYRQGRELLHSELGLEPGERLRALERAILEQDSAIRGPGPTFTQHVVRAAVRRRRALVIAGAVLVVAAVAVAAVEITGGSEAVAVASNSVAVVDATKKRVVADIVLTGRPESIAIGGGAVWVGNGEDGTVSRIDPRTRKVVKTIGLGDDVSDVAYGFGSVWVAGGNAGTLVRIDPRVNLVEKRLTFGSASRLVVQPVFFVEVGSGAVWVTRGNRLLKIDPSTNRVLTSTLIPAGPFGLAAGEAGVWVSTYGERLVRIDPSSAAPTAETELPRWGRWLAVTRGSLWTVVYPGSEGPGQIWQLDPNTLEQTAARPLPSGKPWQLATGDAALWTTDWRTSSVWRVDPARFRFTRLTDVGSSFPTSVAAGFGLVWVGVGKPIS